MSVVKARRSGVWLPRAGRCRGPDGSKVPPNTPAYNTPATVQVANTSALLSAVAGLGAGAGGTVIEVTGNLTGDASIPANANAASWSQNILIRPPLGQRKRVSHVLLDCQRVTFAGFTFDAAQHTAVNLQTRASQSGFWRCVDEVIQQWQIKTATTSACDDQFFVECLSPQWNFQATNDHMHVGGSGDVRRPLVWGCYFSPKLPSVYEANWDIYTNPGLPISYYNAGAVTVASGIPVATLAQSYTFTPPALALIAWLDKPPVGSPVRVTIKINGVSWQTVTLDQSVAQRWRIVRSLARNFSNGDVITLDVEQAGAGATGLHIKVGVDAQAGPGADGPDLHTDTIQHFSGVWVQDITYRDTVIATGNGKAFQIDNTRGDCVWDNCFIGRLPGGSAHQFGSQSALGMRDHIAFCEFQDTLSLDGAGLRTFKHNVAGQYTPTNYTVDPSNAVRPSVPTPPLPDLVAAWPDCPYVVS